MWSWTVEVLVKYLGGQAARERGWTQQLELSGTAVAPCPKLRQWLSSACVPCVF